MTADVLKNVLNEYFGRFRDASIKVAWCSSVGPAELLRAFGFEVYFPENHGALLGATRTAGDCIPFAIKAGYAGDICSYTTSDIGAYLNRQTPLKRYGLDNIPKPDIIVYCTNQCREIQDWFSFYAREFNCPIAGVHPPRYVDDVDEMMIQQVVQEFKMLVETCEKVIGKKLNPDNFSETVRLSREATLLWQECLQTARASPAPWTFFDGCIHMAPIVILRGTVTAVNYYRTLLDELKQKVASGIGAVINETTRIYWDGMPVWGKLRMLSDLFLEHNAAVVASTYCNSWIFDDFDETKPFESTALVYTKIFINRSERAKMNYLQRMIDEYRVDGVIFHDTKTCFNNSNARFGMPQRLKQETGVPVLIVEGDLCDLRFFSEGQTITRIETFIEQIENAKIAAVRQR